MTYILSIDSSKRKMNYYWSCTHIAIFGGQSVTVTKFDKLENKVSGGCICIAIVGGQLIDLV